MSDATRAEVAERGCRALSAELEVSRQENAQLLDGVDVLHAQVEAASISAPADLVEAAGRLVDAVPDGAIAELDDVSVCRLWVEAGEIRALKAALKKARGG